MRIPNVALAVVIGARRCVTGRGPCDAVVIVHRDGRTIMRDSYASGVVVSFLIMGTGYGVEPEAGDDGKDHHA